MSNPEEVSATLATEILFLMTRVEGRDGLSVYELLSDPDEIALDTAEHIVFAAGLYEEEL